MTDQQQMEQFSVAYVRAVAATARVNIYNQDVDDDSTDIGFKKTSTAPDRLRFPQVEAQLKCSAVVGGDDKAFRFPLKSKNYNDLCVDVLVRRILILVVVPETVVDWLTLTPEQLILRKAAYWVSLAGLSPTTNEYSVTVMVPKAQLFDVAALTRLLEPEAAG